MKRSLLAIILVTFALAAGCTSPEEKFERGFKDAVALREAGKAEGALFALEALNQEKPDDPRVLREMGRCYRDLGQKTNAAFFLDQASRLEPGDTDLLREACSALIEAGDTAGAGDRLSQLAEAAPEMLTAEEWILLGEFRAARGEAQPAIDAYLRAVSLQDGDAKGATSLALGTLFIRLDNLAQAERWFTSAVEAGGSDALPALFGLLEIHLRTENWEAAEATIAVLDETFPGALEASEWADARGQLERWREAQEAMQKQLAEAAAEAEKDNAAAEADADDATPQEGEGSTPGEGKEAALADLEQAEALATTAAVAEAPADAEPEAAEEEATEPEIAFDPSIAVEPAEPALGIEVSYDGQEDGPPITFEVETEEAAAPGPGVEDLVALADSALEAGDYDRATELLLRAVGMENEWASLWNRLSLAYLAAGETGDAELTALEAMRLEPETPSYTLDYLRVIQGSKKPADVLAEIEAAHARFPRQPEIVLSLARAYERIARDRVSARNLYSNFIALAPDHPLVPEAEEALRRLR